MNEAGLLSYIETKKYITEIVVGFLNNYPFLYEIDNDKICFCRLDYDQATGINTSVYYQTEDSYCHNGITAYDTHLRSARGGFCYGTQFQLSQVLRDPFQFKVYITNEHALKNLMNKWSFSLEAIMEIKYIDDSFHVSFGEFDYVFRGDRDFFLSWYKKAIRNKFPIKRLYNLFSRFFYRIN